jgi:hypothetical protein
MDEQDLDTISALIGLSAGHICFGSFSPMGWLGETVSSAASVVWENIMSPWTLLEIWNNGTTIWGSPTGESRARVSPNGEIQILQRTESFPHWS